MYEGKNAIPNAIKIYEHLYERLYSISVHKIYERLDSI